MIPLSRRDFITSGTLTVAGAALWQARFPRFGRAFQVAASGSQNLMASPVFIPHDFVGMHAHRWPLGSPASPPPTYPFGAARSHDCDGAHWYDIHTAPGVFNWNALDAWVTANKSLGRTLIYTVYGTPAWAASSTAIVDPYGHPGGAAPPASLQPLTDFITALTARYTVNGSNQLNFIEIWNEPTFEAPQTAYWSGSASQLAAVGRQIWQSAKAQNTAIKILTPGFSGNLAGNLDLTAPALKDSVGSPVYQYLSASDGQGGTGSKWCDGVAFHCYNAPESGAKVGFLSEIQRVQAMLGMIGISLPIYDTELGFLQGDPFFQLSTQGQASVLRRFAAIQASQGVQGLYFYSHDDNDVGNPSVNPQIASAIGDIHTSLAAKTLQQVTLLPDGSVHVTTNLASFTW